MHPFKMHGSWGSFYGSLYEQIIATGSAPLYERFADTVAPEIRPKSTVVDVGCGQGQISSCLARRLPECAVIGVDLSPDMIRGAREANQGIDNLEFRVGDALDLPFEESSVDVALSVASIKHWPDRLRGVRELFRIIRPGGLLVILEAQRGCSYRDALAFAELWRLPPYVARLAALWFQRFVAGQALSLDELVGVMTRAGVIDLDARQEPGLPFVVGMAGKS